MTVKTEGQHAGEFLVSEAPGTQSRESVTVLSGEVLKAGHVVGKIKVGTASATAGGGNTGDGSMGAITVGAGAMAGDYVLTITEAATNAGEFQVVDPEGDVVGLGTVGSEFSGGGLTFTLADGAADFAKGDTFTITVAEGSGKIVEWDPAANDGSEIAAGVLFDNVDATSGDKKGVLIARLAEVNGAELVYLSGATSGNKATAAEQLEKRNIIVR
ncbi:head decoration protein [Marinobacterium litorale]|uniref:head decoration protein n=1 Tax=Marinobacterium litorale TaxID=404770 RepID=UPI000416AE3F|nr:head decoration protein [Marinobacterium litorale]